MTAPDSHLYGTSDAPLAATRRYSFRRVVDSSGEAHLTIPIVHRNSCDDLGEVERAEQEAFVERFLTSLGVARRTGYPGEWVFPDVATLDVVWSALGSALAEPLASAPSATVRRAVSAAEAATVLSELTRRFLELVSAVAGLTGPAFTCVNRHIDTSTPETKRTEVWRRGEVVVSVEGLAIESGHGVHGEHCTLGLGGTLGDGRDVRATSDIDVRSGGSVEVTVSGVNDARALAVRFVEPS